MSFWSDFTGSSARKDIRAGQEAANKELTTGETTARSDYDAGIARLDPYAEGGQDAYNAYLASLGLRGPDELKTVQDQYLNDPIQNAIADRITKQFSRKRAYSGEAGAVTGGLTNALLANWTKRQDQLKGAGDTGVQVAGAQSGMETGKGDLSFGAAQQRAGVDIGAANAIAASRSTAINNIGQLAGIGLKAYGVSRGVRV